MKYEYSIWGNHDKKTGEFVKRWYHEVIAGVYIVAQRFRLRDQSKKDSKLVTSLEVRA